MKHSSNISNYLKEKKDLEEKYNQLHNEVNAKYQIDQYLLKKNMKQLLLDGTHKGKILTNI